MTRQLVLVHGRAQQLKDPDQLKKDWLAALRKGLDKNGLTLPIAEEDVRFPFYGDTLVALIEGKSPEEAAKIVVRGTDDDPELQAFMRDALEEVREQKGISEAELREVAGDEVVEKGPLNWGWLQAVMEVVDRKLPGGSGMSIALATHDVYQYLVAESIKHEIDEGVSAAFTPGVETVVVGHSLGSVVAYNVLRERLEAEGWVVPLYVTVGSPLGVTRIRRSIPPPRWPQGLGAWFNALDTRDVVALFPLSTEHFDVGADHTITTHADVDNHTDNRHGIAGYLDDAEVAKVIHQALTAD